MKLLEYQSKKNYIISFPYGSKITIRNNNLFFGKVNGAYADFYSPRIALGLSAINMDIYKCASSHSLVHKQKGRCKMAGKDCPNKPHKHEVIYDNTKKMYYVACDIACDSNRKF
tara:strand:- start:3869 stop:4210 length:342 start_codon:yes stop_codon:yes gene_type:complete